MLMIIKMKFLVCKLKKSQKIENKTKFLTITIFVFNLVMISQTGKVAHSY